ncbi:MAG TPA: flagellar biosynthesis repressor FlbT [Acetobacteraceae bacterium]|nr:flagellar biosynthesis repressor FlbT [Acetobacteraceae bacterium]
MPLKLKLAAHERLVVNGAVLVNGDSRASIIVRNFAHVMREKDVLQEVDANTPTKRLYFLVQAMLMQPPPSAELMGSYHQAHGQLVDAFARPENIAILNEVKDFVVATDYYKALAKLHPLIAYEAGLLNVEPHQWRRASSLRTGDASVQAGPRLR